MKSGFKRFLNYVSIPILFAALGYGLFYMAARPFLPTLSQAVTLVTLDRAPRFKTTQTAATFTKPNQPVAQKRVATQVRFPKYGALFGEVSIPKLDLHQPLYFGDGPEQLAQGAGMFNGSSYPGLPGTTLIAGHNTSAMGRIVQAQAGQQVVLDTTYGTYTYRITQTKVATYDDAKAFSLDGHHKLILYTCYPTTTLGYTNQRFVVYAELISGPLITED